jgi:hypothetical protein
VSAAAVVKSVATRHPIPHRVLQHRSADDAYLECERAAGARSSSNIKGGSRAQPMRRPVPFLSCSSKPQPSIVWPEHLLSSAAQPPGEGTASEAALGVGDTAAGRLRNEPVTCAGDDPRPRGGSRGHAPPRRCASMLPIQPAPLPAAGAGAAAYSGSASMKIRICPRATSTEYWRRGPSSLGMPGRTTSSWVSVGPTYTIRVRLGRSCRAVVPPPRRLPPPPPCRQVCVCVYERVNQ